MRRDTHIAHDARCLLLCPFVPDHGRIAAARRLLRMSDPAPRKQPISFRSKTWAMDVIRKNTPTREEMAQNKYLAPIAHRFLSPELWRFTRRSVPRGVALGLFAAFIIPVGQIFLSAFLALPLRANVPLAALITFVTNPFTLPFWLVVANRIGEFLLRFNVYGVALPSASADGDSWGLLTMIYEMGLATVLGGAVLAVVSPLLGWLISGWVWRAIVYRKRAKRLKTMEARLDRRLGAQ
jgi:uncharacterized protein